MDATYFLVIYADFGHFAGCVNHKKLRHLRAIYVQNHAKRSIACALAAWCS